MEKVVILGTGPAGLTAAIYLARANMKPIIIEGTQPGGQLTLTTEVENFPGFVDAIMGPELMDNMRKQAERFGAEFKRGWVTDVDLSKNPYTLQVYGLGGIQTEALILSTGASAKLLNIPGVFACGDVQDRKYRQAITAAGTGCMAALDAERYLESNSTHDWSKSL